MRLASQTDVFQAIATPIRRDIIQKLAQQDGQSLSKLATAYPMSRQAVTRHINVLRDTGVITVRKLGREQMCHLNALALKEVYEWVAFYEQFWDDKLDKLGDFLASSDDTYT